MTKLLVCLMLLISCSLTADIKVSNLFGDNMILQQKTSNAIWGFAEAGEIVTVSTSWGEKAAARTNSQGKWKVMLKTPAYGTGHSMSIKGRNTINIKNIAIGEVWLCAGQSNMGWAVRMSFDGNKDVAAINLPNFRIFKSAREHWHEPIDISRDRLSRWKTCNPVSAAETSAVSFYFGKKLHEELGIPVGIIVQAYSGTPIEGWMPREIQKDDARTITNMKLMDEMDKRLSKKGITREKAITKFYQELVIYNKKIDAGQIMKNKIKALEPPFITKPSSIGHQYPSNIFNAMINPIRPYGIRGVIWYQGERNSKNAAQALHYRKQLGQLINYYRSSWHEMSEGNVAKDFPFQFTQLPSWNPAQKVPVEGAEAVWAINREMMRMVTQDIPNTALSVAIDTGDAVDLHPKNKKPIGLRHAYLALKNTYEKDFTGNGPRYQSYRINGSKIILKFDSIGSGLMTGKAGALDSFAIAGLDRKWHWAEAKISGNKITLSSSKVSKPAAARYAWAMNPSQRNLLYNKEGLPASPFRTDNWPLYDPKAEIITVFKPAKTDKKATKDWDRPIMNQ